MTTRQARAFMTTTALARRRLPGPPAPQRFHSIVLTEMMAAAGSSTGNFGTST
jgi:hypothetical protein